MFRGLSELRRGVIVGSVAGSTAMLLTVEIVHLAFSSTKNGVAISAVCAFYTSVITAVALWRRKEPRATTEMPVNSSAPAAVNSPNGNSRIASGENGMDGYRLVVQILCDGQTELASTVAALLQVPGATVSGVNVGNPPTT